MKFPAKPAAPAVPILEVVTQRWSPYAFDSKPIEPEVIAQLLEAARWAPSSFNEQPWRYVYALKSDAGRATIESLLMDGNAWAKNAGLLMVSFARKNFTYNGKPNRHALHDTGCASGFMVLEATSRGLISHQMAGFHVDKANEVLGVSDEYEPGSMIAIGYPGDANKLPDDLKKREEAPRTRKSVAEFATRK